MNITDEQHRRLIALAKMVNEDESIAYYARFICAEEPSELTQAVTKAARGKLDKDNMAEEIADNIICHYWDMEINDIPWSMVSNWIDRKILRCARRIESGEFR